MPRRKPQPASHQTPQTASSNKGKPQDAGGASASPPKSTKQDAILRLLGQSDGTTIDAIMQATGWQPHSVRAFLAGTIKRLGLTLVSEKVDGQRVYRLPDKKRTKSRATPTPAPSAS